MTTTCTHPCTVVNHPSPKTLRWPTFSVWRTLARLGAWASHGTHDWLTNRRQADALHHMDLRQLQDMGAPDWLQQQAAARQAQDCYEYMRAMTRVKY